MLTREKLWEFTLAISKRSAAPSGRADPSGRAPQAQARGATNRQPENYGILYHQSIVNVPLPTLTFGQPIGAVFPSKRHRAVGKETGKTSYIERFNNTLRQRVSRLVRKTLSFSKSLENHIGAIWYFIHHYN